MLRPYSTSGEKTDFLAVQICIFPNFKTTLPSWQTSLNAGVKNIYSITSLPAFSNFHAKVWKCFWKNIFPLGRSFTLFKFKWIFLRETRRFKNGFLWFPILKENYYIKNIAHLLTPSHFSRLGCCWNDWPVIWVKSWEIFCDIWARCRIWISHQIQKCNPEL